MSASLAEIKEAYREGESDGRYSHMLVCLDTFDMENYFIYVPKGDDPVKHKPSNGDPVDECYRFSLGWYSQAAEGRANHYEYDPAPVEIDAVTPPVTESKTNEATNHIDEAKESILAAKEWEGFHEANLLLQDSQAHALIAIAGSLEQIHLQLQLANRIASDPRSLYESSEYRSLDSIAPILKPEIAEALGIGNE